MLLCVHHHLFILLSCEGHIGRQEAVTFTYRPLGGHKSLLLLGKHLAVELPYGVPFPRNGKLTQNGCPSCSPSNASAPI